MNKYTQENIVLQFQSDDGNYEDDADYFHSLVNYFHYHYSHCCDVDDEVVVNQM